MQSIKRAILIINSYLRDCLTIFQQPSDKLDMEKFKGAMTSIERIIRAKPDDLGIISITIIME